ncbi:NADP-dependent oxidoreductase domain-containing protein [Lipomyces oligophaga]|uniref:NADP-dependent oxidoreductase domain-containing protein n=1 Tax=Lipomyces oligophaga TaxID=45792 RepID=UPI0034CFCEA1
MTEFDPKDMEYRFLGNTGLRVSALSFGGWLGVNDDTEEIIKQCFIEAWNHGVNFFDTAEIYSNGKCELVFGRILKDLGWTRSDYVISTKLYFGFGEKSPNGRGLSRKHLIEGMDKSLKRLQLDYVDVVFAHRPDREGVPMEEVVRAFTQLILDGKALYWGTSEWSAFEIEHAHHIATKFNLIAPIAEQPQYNALTRNRFEAEYKPLYDLYKYGTTVWSPLAGGILTGKYSQGFKEGSRYTNSPSPVVQRISKTWSSPEGLAKIAKVEKLGPIAERLDCSIAQLSLAFLLKNKNVSTIILGASKAEQVTENLKSLDVYRKLTDKDIEAIEEVLQNKPDYSALF